MGSVATERRTKGAGSGLSGLTGAEWVDVYRLMYMSRRLDDREILLKNQQKIFFQISGAGHHQRLVAGAGDLKEDLLLVFQQDFAVIEASREVHQAVDIDPFRPA